MKDHSDPRDARGPFSIASIDLTPRPRNRLKQTLAMVTVLVASLLVVLAGIPVMSDLLLSDGPGPPPAEGSVVAIGSLGCVAASDRQPAKCADGEIAAVVDALDPALVLPLGHVSLPTAEAAATDVSSRIWRRLASRMRPVLTDYRIAEEINMETPSVPGRAGYYSYDFAGWHLIALNGDCSAVGGCGPGSPQERWLADDLRRSPAKCTLAYWNKPRFSSGGTGGDSAYDAFWRRLYSAGAELVLSAGEGHGYERFARQSPDATLDLRRGLRQFVVGTGAAPAMSFRATPSPHSVVRNGDTPGVLQLILEPESYRWHFVPIFGHRFRDAGAGTCRP